MEAEHGADLRPKPPVIPWLEPGAPLPPVERALRRPSGLLAAGGDLSPESLVAAYRRGIFPWYSAGDPILWWSPDPRTVLFPAKLRVARSLAKRLRKGGFEVRADTAFRRVIEACASVPRAEQSGTWITSEMQDAYAELHRRDIAHSVETWIDGELAGGLYGVALGRMFFGESMFAWVSDASKIALVRLVRHLDAWGFGMIDCQMATRLLSSFGAQEIARAEFTRRLEELIDYPPVAGLWRLDAL